MAEFMLMIVPSEIISSKRKVKVVAGSTEQLVEAIAEKLKISPSFVVWPFDDDFDEFAPLSAFSEIPHKCQVQLRPAVEVEAQPEPEPEPVAVATRVRPGGGARRSRQGSRELSDEEKRSLSPAAREAPAVKALAIAKKSGAAAGAVPPLGALSSDARQAAKLAAMEKLKAEQERAARAALSDASPTAKPDKSRESEPVLRLEVADPSPKPAEAIPAGPMMVVCPTDARAGDLITVLLDAGGSELELQIPAGVRAGDAFEATISRGAGGETKAVTRRVTPIATDGRPVATMDRLERLAKTPEIRRVNQGAVGKLNSSGKRVGGSVGSQAEHCTFAPKITPHPSTAGGSSAKPESGGEGGPPDRSSWERLSKPRVVKAPPSETAPSQITAASPTQRRRARATAEEGEPPSLYEREQRATKERALRLQAKKEAMEREEVRIDRDIRTLFWTLASFGCLSFLLACFWNSSKQRKRRV